MDRETVRMILLVLGSMLIIGVYIWGRYRERLLDFIHRRGEYDELDYAEPEEEPPEPTNTTRHDPSFAAFAASSADRIAQPAAAAKPLSLDNDDDDDLGYFQDDLTKPAETAPATREPARAATLGAPFLIQISVVAPDNEIFNGEELRDALVELDLIYGDMGIYHRYDREYRQPLFSIASLVEPGTFPVEHMERFECPGVVLFFQPPQVDDPLEVFDDLITTCHDLADRLGGVEWDERREPLTEQKIAQMRERLQEAY